MEFSEKVILVTGGTGSFGQKFTEIVLQKYPPQKLIIFSRDELKQFQMKEKFPADENKLHFLIGDIRDKERVSQVLEGVNIVIHAATLKHVPITEYHPLETIKTNIIGAANLIKAALEQKVEKIIAISTDKAVSPVSLYGGSKFCAEKLFLAANISQNCTRFSVVRYGNMIGSRGSVIPLFKEKKHEGVLPITDTRMTRFWITLEESVEFTLRCIEMMSGGEIFVPKIPSMNILELAQAICPKCQHKIIGPRPGEKLHEELISEDEARFTWEWEDFFVIQPEFIPSAKKWQNGKKVPDRFTYRSDTNRNWLRREELRKLIKNF